MTLDERVNRLERQNRRLKQVVTLIAILGVSAVLMGAERIPMGVKRIPGMKRIPMEVKGIPRQVVAKSFLVKGDSGRTVKLTEYGLEMRDPKGNMRGAFYGGLIYLYRKGGREGLRLNRNGLRLLDNKGIVRITVARDGIQLYDGIRGKLRLRTVVGPKGEARVQFFDARGIRRTDVGFAEGFPYLVLYDRRGARRAVMTIDPNPGNGGSVRVYSEKKQSAVLWGSKGMAGFHLNRRSGRTKLVWSESTDE